MIPEEDVSTQRVDSPETLVKVELKNVDVLLIAREQWTFPETQTHLDTSVCLYIKRNLDKGLHDEDL